MRHLFAVQLVTVIVFVLTAPISLALQEIDDLEDTAPAGTIVSSRVIDGVVVTITSGTGISLFSVEYNTSPPYAFAGVSGPNTPLTPSEVSGSFFISTSDQTIGNQGLLDVVGFVRFEFSQPISSFGLTTIDLLESQTPQGTTVHLRGFDNQSMEIASHALSMNQGASGVVVPWLISLPGSLIWSAELSFTGSLGGGGGYGIDDIMVDRGIPGSTYCFGDGTGATCPCFGFGGPGQGCQNSGGLGGATLAASGAAILSTDTIQLSISGVPGAKPGLLLRGDDQTSIPVGDGILCTSGASQRSQVQVTVAGATTFTNFNGGPFGAVANVGAPTNFQFWYRDPQNTCSGQGFNFTNGWTVTYLP